MNSKHKRWKLVCYLCVMCLVVIYFFVANDIVYHFQSTDTDFHSFSGFNDYRTTMQGYAVVESFDYYGGEMEVFHLYGWAYAEKGDSVWPIKDKETYVLLKNASGNVYRAKAVVTIRPDIYYSQTDLGRKPISGNVGFEARMSTLVLSSGEYELYFYVYENEEVMALIPTNLLICKKDNTVYVQERAVEENGSEKTENVVKKSAESDAGENTLIAIESVPDNASAVCFGIDKLEVENTKTETIVLYGWAFCATVADNIERTVHVILKQEDGDNIYSALVQKTDRTNLVRLLPAEYQEMETMLGVYATLSIKDVESGTYALLLSCHENDEAYGIIDTGYRLTKEEGKSNLYEKVFVPVQIDALPDDAIAYSYAALDEFEVQNNGAVSMSGWAFCKTTEDNANKTIQMILHSEENDFLLDTIVGKIRIDLYNTFHNSLNLQGFNHGFVSSVHTDASWDQGHSGHLHPGGHAPV